MSSSLQNKKKNLRSSTLHTLRPVGGAAPLPTAMVPTPPEEVGAASKARSLSPVTRVHLDVAPEAARELRASTSFSAVVGSRVAHAGMLADAIDFAFAWSRHAKAAEAWQAYATQQSRFAWDYVIAQLDVVRSPLLAAEATDPTIGQELGAFMRLVSARADASRRAVATRRTRKRLKAPAPQPGASSSTSPSATASPSPSPSPSPSATLPTTTAPRPSSLPS